MLELNNSMTTKQFVLQLFIFLATGQLVALAVYYIWDERMFGLMIIGSIGGMIGTWVGQRSKRKAKEGSR